MISDAANSSALPMTSTCHLSGIMRWTPSTHLAGIQTTTDLWELDSGFFSCCGASGIEIHDLQTKLARLCGLTPRWAQLKDHIQFIVKTFPSQVLTDILGLGAKPRSQSHVSSVMLEALEKWRKFNVPAIAANPRGRVLSDNTEFLPGVTVDWAGSASLIWHDGVRVFMHLHGSGAPPVAKWQRELQSSPGRTIVWVERVHNLFDAAKLLEFDEAISFAASNGLPLWVDLKRTTGEAKSAGEPKTDTRKFSKILDRKMANYRSGPLEKWLSAQTLSRFCEVCEWTTAGSGKEAFVIPPVV